ncbi:MAG: formyltransferase family protein [Veillonella sp.]
MTSSVAKKRLALFASGRGSNGEALYKAMQEGYINGKFVVIITDHGDAGIVERSKPWSIPLIVIERSDYDSKTSFEQAQLDALEPYKVDGIVLAGYMRIVGMALLLAMSIRFRIICSVPSFPDFMAINRLSMRA